MLDSTLFTPPLGTPPGHPQSQQSKQNETPNFAEELSVLISAETILGRRPSDSAAYQSRPESLIMPQRRSSTASAASTTQPLNVRRVNSSYEGHSGQQQQQQQTTEEEGLARINNPLGTLGRSFTPTFFPPHNPQSQSQIEKPSSQYPSAMSYHASDDHGSNQSHSSHSHAHPHAHFHDHHTYARTHPSASGPAAYTSPPHSNHPFILSLPSSTPLDGSNYATTSDVSGSRHVDQLVNLGSAPQNDMTTIKLNASDILHADKVARRRRKELLRSALALAQQAVEFDSDNKFPAALKSYFDAVGLLNDLLKQLMLQMDGIAHAHRLAEASDHASTPSPSGMRSYESIKSSQEEELKRLRVIHDIYVDRIRLLAQMHPEAGVAVPEALNSAPFPESQASNLSQYQADSTETDHAFITQISAQSPKQLSGKTMIPSALPPHHISPSIAQGTLAQRRRSPSPDTRMAQEPPVRAASAEPPTSSPPRTRSVSHQPPPLKPTLKSYMSYNDAMSSPRLATTFSINGSRKLQVASVSSTSQGLPSATSSPAIGLRSIGVGGSTPVMARIGSAPPIRSASIHSDSPRSSSFSSYAHHLGLSVSSATLPVAPYEPAPLNALQRPFHLMRALTASIQHGAFISSKLYIPKEVWECSMGSNKVQALDTKMKMVELLLGSLTALTESQDPIAVTRALEDLEACADEVQNTLAKKLGKPFTEVGSVTDSAPSHASTAVTKKNSMSGWQARVGRWSGKITSATALAGNNKTDTITLYVDWLARLFSAAQILDRYISEVAHHHHSNNISTPADSRILIQSRNPLPALILQDQESSSSSVQASNVDVKLRRLAEFFGNVVCRFVVKDLTILLDRVVISKKGSNWILE